jgi:SAM-dependent methyltransferase
MYGRSIKFVNAIGAMLPPYARHPISLIKRHAISLYRAATGQSNTWWDNQDRRYLRDEFHRNDVQGIDHESRRYVRSWLYRHPGLTLLDIPCGAGVEYEGLLRDKTPVRYIGMDKSDSMVAVMRDRFHDVDVRSGDIEHVPLPARSVDVVLCRHILEHLADYRRAVTEAIRVSRRHVFIILFLVPYRSERQQLGWGTWNNRLFWPELESFIGSLNVDIHALTLLYGRVVPKWIEENTVIHLVRRD